METSSVLLTFCGGNAPVISEFPSQGPLTRSFDDLCLNKWLNKQMWGWWQAHYDVTVMAFFCHTSRATPQIRVTCCVALRRRLTRQNDSKHNEFVWLGMFSEVKTMSKYWLMFLHHGLKIKLWYFESRSISKFIPSTYLIRSYLCQVELKTSMCILSTTGT